MRLHHDAAMRTTIDLPEDLHRIATGLARHSGRSLSQTVAELMERGLAQPAARAGAGFARNRTSGLPVVRSQRAVTADDVAALEDQA